MNINPTNLQQEVLEKSLWQNKNFLFLWTGSILSNFGFQIYLITLPLLIYDLTQSALAMSTMRAIDFFPNIIIGMIAGVLVDRYHRKWILSITVILRILCLSGIVYLLYVDQIELWHLYLLGFVLSASGYTFGNAHHSVLPQLVTKQQLTAANAKLSFVDTLISMTGPGIAGVLIALYSFEVNFSLYLVCLALLLICVQFTRIPATVKQEKKVNSSIWKEMKEGIDSLLSNKILLTPTIAVLFNNFSASLVTGVLIFYAADILDTTKQQIGFMFSMGAVGGLVGSICIPFLRRKFGRGKLYVSCIFLEAISYLILVFSIHWWMLSLSLFIRVFAITMSNVVYFTIRQEFTPNHLLGRVAGTSSMLMKLAVPLGLFISGLWAEFLPIPLLFIMSTLLTLILFAILRKHTFASVE
ncbi:MFS transporter [Bacillus horti]|uniref:MFS family permease n=1 Tax=Caldalkalibacillus horti TaxID=77523 RepID=A0ABT9W0Z1_9BACI|nr:MFS transporter [Bacillus horti]MDQ0166902.1 MFS family permease [Bacillus horti]